MSKVAGVGRGQRQLNGPQTTGREYRNLSEPAHGMRCDQDVAVGMRDGTQLLADVHRPDGDGRFPALIAASPYPRQIQDLGAPMGFIEAGATDFWVPRGYVHVIANLRGTGGSGGTFGFFDAQERRDLHDLVEWAAVQPWCDGNVGMIGISYFAMAQLEAAVERPPHLRAIFPVAVTTDLYEAVMHHGLFSSSFVTPFLAMVGLTSGRSDRFWRSTLVDAARDILRTAPLHRKFATMNGESSVAVLHAALKLHHDPHPWDDLWRTMAVEHPLRDEWWDERNLMPLLDRVEVPTYLGCDWQNVPLHLPSTFPAMRALVNAPVVRVGMLGEFGLTWPWESLHIEALAWFDHWLKDQDTGILEGPAIRYWMPGADEWRTSDVWPPADSEPRVLSLRADGELADDEGDPGERSLMVLDPGLRRSGSSDADPPTQLVWTSAPLEHALDVVGDIELELHAARHLSIRHGSSPSRMWHPTTPSRTSPPDGSGPACAASIQPPARSNFRVARPRSWSLVRSPPTASRSSPTLDGSRSGTAFDSSSPATTRTRPPQRSWISVTRRWAPAATQSTRHPSSCCRSLGRARGKGQRHEHPRRVLRGAPEPRDHHHLRLPRLERAATAA